MRMKIDFTDICIPVDIDRKEYIRQDVRRDFANVIYRLGSGIESHALALKIFNAKGPEEYSDQECVLLRRYAEQCNPAFIDAMNEVLKAHNPNNKEE